MSRITLPIESPEVLNDMLNRLYQKEVSDNLNSPTAVSGTGPFKVSRYVPGIVTEFEIHEPYWRTNRGAALRSRRARRG